MTNVGEVDTLVEGRSGSRGKVVEKRLAPTQPAQAIPSCITIYPKSCLSSLIHLVRKSKEKRIARRISSIRAHLFLKLRPRLILAPQTGRKDMLVPLIPPPVYHFG